MATLTPVYVACPACGVRLTVPVSLGPLRRDENGLFTNVEPDLTVADAHRRWHERRGA